MSIWIKQVSLWICIISIHSIMKYFNCKNICFMIMQQLLNLFFTKNQVKTENWIIKKNKKDSISFFWIFFFFLFRELYKKKKKMESIKEKFQTLYKTIFCYNIFVLLMLFVNYTVIHLGIKTLIFHLLKKRCSFF